MDEMWALSMHWAQSSGLATYADKVLQSSNNALQPILCRQIKRESLLTQDGLAHAEAHFSS